MNPRRELAKLYAELAGAGGNTPAERLKLIDKALYWVVMPDEAEATQKNRRQRPKFDHGRVF